MSNNSNTKYLILACDGGGIRGLITSLLLQQIDQLYPNFLGQTYLYAGTSTGGIISLALACGQTPTDLVGLYSGQGSTIFTESKCRTGAAPKVTIEPSPTASDSESWWTIIVDNFMKLICPWYDNDGLLGVIENTIPDAASLTLNSLGHYVLVNTMQLFGPGNAWTPLQLTNLPNIGDNTSGDTFVLDAAMSTSAAPMYFPPYKHPTYGYCADGGVFANNPGTIALTTLIESDIALENIWMLSLSTGNTLDCYPPSIIETYGASNFGPFAWMFPISQSDPAVAGPPYTPAMPLMNVVFDGISDVDDYQCTQLLGGRYVRAHVPLTQPIALDDFSPAAITAMHKSVTKYFTLPDWDTVTQWIQNNFDSSGS